MWKRTLIITAVIIMQCTVTVSGTIKQIFAVRDASLSGKVFNDDILFQDVRAQSVLYCARLCRVNEGCVTFTASPHSSGSGVVCRGHTSTVTSQFSNSASSGTKLFYVKETSVWAGESCTSNQDCTVTNSVCYSNLCLCAPGDYYSVRQNLCVPKCADGDLQATFSLRYPGIGITGHNIVTVYNNTVSECQQTCLGNTAPCQNVEYHYSANPTSCNLHAVTAKDYPGNWDADTGWDFYSRDCF